MYEGKLKRIYTGTATGAQSFILATYVVELTGPDELPYLTVQVSRDETGAWSTRTYEDHFITDFAASDRFIALTRYGQLLDPLSGDVISNVVDRFDHQNNIAVRGNEVVLCGDNGSFWRGPPDALAPYPNPFYRPKPAAGAPIQGTVAWAQGLQLIFGLGLTAGGETVICGPNGFLAMDRNGSWDRMSALPSGDVMALASGDDGRIWAIVEAPGKAIVSFDTASFTPLVEFDLPAGPYFTAIHQHLGTLYLGASVTGQGIYQWQGGQVFPAPFSNPDLLGSVRKFESVGDVLWCFCERAVLRVEGETWEVITIPTEL